MIFTGQKIPLTTTFTDDDGVVNITGATIRYDYWLPSNGTATPSGYVNGSIVDAASGTARGEIPAAPNIASDCWRVQAVLTLSGDEWPAVVTAFKVYLRGSGTTCPK